MHSYQTILLLSFLIGIISCDGPVDCQGKKNLSPVLDIIPQPLKTVQNGQSWLIKEDTNYVYVAKVSGTAYEMGYAFSQLYGKEIQQNLIGMVDFGYQKVEDILKPYGVPKPIIKIVQSKALALFEKGLDWNYRVAKPYIPQRFIDELQGMADGSDGLFTFDDIKNVNMLPELTRAACSMVGAFASATADNKLYHLRALDWSPTAPVNQFPSIIIYEPSEEGSNVFANIGYMGLIGTLTAMSKNGISVGEKQMWVGDPSAYPMKPTTTYHGKPWMFVLRDAAQFSKNLNDVEKSLLETDRTMKVHLGFGSFEDKSFRGVDYAANFVQFFDDQNFTRYSDAHPQLDGIFFYDKNWQPSTNKCLGNILTENHGQITPETLYSDVAGYHQTGDAQVCVMDPEGQQIWLTYSQYGASVNAYERSPMHIKLYEFW